MSEAWSDWSERPFLVCPDCEGVGEIEYGHPNAPDAEGVRDCRRCDGTGEIEDDSEPVEEEDLWECEG